MKNLKKVLSLVLVFAMAFGLVMSASATTLSDWDDIKNQEAVQLLDSLQIMSGRADGSFDPDGFLTRAEVAKMIYVARTGGVDDKAVLYKGSSNTFTDTKGHWAEGYINYAFTKGFVSGRGNGKFDPNATITGFELLKITLTALGYDAKAEGFVGTGWKANVAALAQEAGLTEGYASDPNLQITRDEAAAIFSNLIFASTIRYEEGYAYQYLVNGNTVSFGVSYLNLKQYTGILTANEFAGLQPTAFTTVDNTSVIFTDADKDGVIDAGEEHTIPAETSIDLLGYNVTALVREKVAGTITKVYSVAKTVGKNNDLFFLTATAGVSPKFYVNYATDSEANAKAADEVKYIDNNGDKKYEIIRGINRTYGTVATASTATATGIITVNGTMTSTDYNGLETLAYNDRFLSITKNGQMAKGYVVEIAPITGKFTQFIDNASTGGVYADGVKYGYSTYTGAEYANLTGSTVKAANIGLSGSFYVYDGKILEFKVADAPEANYCYVYEIGATSNGFSTWTASAKVVLSDGTSATYPVYGSAAASEALSKATVHAGFNTYLINAAGQIVLTQDVADATDASFDGYNATGLTANRFSIGANNYYVNAKTKVFVEVAAGKWVVYTGVGNIPAMSNATGTLDIITGNYVATGDLAKYVAVANATVTAGSTKYYLAMTTPVVTGFDSAVTGDTIYSFKAFDVANKTVTDFTYGWNDNGPAADDSYVVSKSVFTFTAGTPLTAAVNEPLVSGVATVSENNVIGFKLCTDNNPYDGDGYEYAAATPVAYNYLTEFYKINYTNGTGVQITAADVPTVVATNDGMAPNVQYIDHNSDGLAEFVFVIEG